MALGRGVDIMRQSCYFGVGCSGRNVAEQAERLFYPDWIVQLGNGKVCIFDTEPDRTLNTAGRAKGPAIKLQELGDGFVGGIVRHANGIFE